MSWAQDEAKRLIERHPNREEFVVASGVSPSGFIHIGNFREIVTTFFVAKELERLGKKVRFILSFDDFDRFRKVPSGIDKEYEKYIGMPYSSIPSPFNSNKTYAREMEERFINELAQLDIHPEFISQTEQYKSGRYREKIKLAMQERKRIFDILAKYKTQEFTEEDRENYYPISLYCENCGKDNTVITNYNPNTGDISYRCSCGYQHTENINEKTNMKLQWKVDWPMRWQEEGVLLEPGGRDHSAENGSYAVSREISRDIFHYEAPYYIPYDFIGIKGANGKMASSTGNVLTLTDLLSVYDMHLILWFYAKNMPSHAFNIALDDDVLRFYTEFDRLVKAYFNQKLDANNANVISLTGVRESYVNNPDFATIANFLPMVNYNIESLKRLLNYDNMNCTPEQFESRVLKASSWLNAYGNSKVIIRNEFNQEYYDTLTDEEKELIRDTLSVLQDDYENSVALQNALYQVINKGVMDMNELKAKQKRYFEIIYNMIIGCSRGPKLGLLLSAIDKKVIKILLDSNEKRKVIVKF